MDPRLRGGDFHGWRDPPLMVIPAEAGIQAFFVHGGGPKAHDVFAQNDNAEGFVGSSQKIFNLSVRNFFGFFWNWVRNSFSDCEL